jgi:hypothetical protein
MMRKFLVLVLALAWSGCKEEDDGPTIENCTANELGAFKCTGNLLMQCNGTQWVQSDDCAANTPVQTCHDSGNGVARCQNTVTAAGEFESCTPGVTGACEGTMTCQTSEFSEYFSDRCLNACPCDSDTYCEEFLFATPACWVKVGRLEGCLANEGCIEGECVPNETVMYADASNVFYAFECNLTCPFTEAGTQGTVCLTDETCLLNGRFEPQWQPAPNDDEPVECTIANPTECNTAGGYFCKEYSDGDFCAKPLAYCGEPVPTTVNFTEAHLGDNGDIEDYCGDTYNLCVEAATGTAEIYCAPFGNGLWVYPDPEGGSGDYVECEDPFDCAQFQFKGSDGNLYWASGECVSATDGTNTFQLCAQMQSICINFCEDAEGGALECPDGQTCGFPAVSAGYKIREGTAPTYVPCDDNTDCTTAQGYECIEFTSGGFCARDMKVCGTAGVTP